MIPGSDTSGPTLTRSAAGIGWQRWVFPALLISALAVAYAETAQTFVRSWSGRDDYSHGFIVPFVSLYMAWAQRERLRKTTVCPDPVTGSLILFLGGFMLVAGKLGSFMAAEQASVLLVAPGLVLLLFGRAVFRALLFPLAYLILMVPAIIDPFIASLHWPLQLFGATCAASLLSFAGVPVVREHQFLALPGVTLEVANVCSGVRYLISIIALSLPLALFTLRRTSHRIMLLLTALFIGIAANPVRIALIGMWVYYRGPEQVHGPGHILQGFFISMVGFVFLFIAAAAISWFGGDTRIAAASTAAVAPVVHSQREVRRVAFPWVVAIVFVGLVAITVHSFHPRPVPLALKLSTLPLSIGAWNGEEVTNPKSFLRLGSAGDEMERIYRSSDGRETRLYVGYLRAQTQESKLISYSVQSIYDRAKIEKLGEPGSNPVNVNSAVVLREGGRAVICYWYVLGGRSLARPLWVKVATALRGITTGRTNGAIVAISRDVPEERDLPSAIEDVREFAQSAYPLLAGMLRDE